MVVWILATLDTKGREAAFVRDELAKAGVETALVDVGCLGEPAVKPDVPREDVFRAAGTTLEAVRTKADRGQAVTKAAEGAVALVSRGQAEGRLTGVFGLGGSAGTTIATAAMRALPIGVPKVMVSTLASGAVGHFIGSSDILMMNSVVDISGINRVSRAVLARAAQAMAGMARGKIPPGNGDRPLVAASMFGVTTPCVERARAALEAEGFEVLVFHATGTGGRTLESLARDGMLAGVLDLTTTELADELVGGVLSAGPDRLTAAGERGIPQVVSVGALDMVNFHGIEAVPERFRGRKLHVHNANVTLMRTTSAENEKLGTEIGRKLSASKGPVTVILPLRGVSAIDREGQPFDDPEARGALFGAIRTSLRGKRLVEVDAHINDPSFADAASAELLAMITETADRARGGRTV